MSIRFVSNFFFTSLCFAIDLVPSDRNTHQRSEHYDQNIKYLNISPWRLYQEPHVKLSPEELSLSGILDGFPSVHVFFWQQSLWPHHQSVTGWGERHSDRIQRTGTRLFSYCWPRQRPPAVVRHSALHGGDVPVMTGPTGGWSEGLISSQWKGRSSTR